MFRLSRNATLAVLVIGCSSTPDELAPAEGGRHQPLSHLDATTADNSAISEEELERRRAMLRDYARARQERLQIVTTTTTDTGQTLDWIPIDSQAPGGIAEPPPDEADPPPRNSDMGESAVGQSPPESDSEKPLGFGIPKDARGPDGTVPVVRMDIEGYLARVRVPPATIQEFLAYQPSPAPNANNRYYVYLWSSSVTNYGTRGNINAWDAEGPFDGPIFADTSIAQSSVGRGTGNGYQTVEVGQMKSLLSPTAPGDGRPYLFVFYTTNNYTAPGNNLGGYNQEVTGWVQESTSIVPGLSLSAPLSTTGGNQHYLDIRTRHFNLNWYVYINGIRIGYYPPSLFSVSGVRNSASKYSWYGEVYDSFAPTPTATDMGSGSKPINGFGFAAYMRDIAYYHTNNNTGSFWAPLTFFTPTDSNCYTREGPFNNVDPNVVTWRNWAYFGGPGDDANCN